MNTFWLLIVILAHLFYALIFIIDKYIISRPLPHPIVYTFYIGILSICVWVLALFGFSFPSGYEILLILLAGISQVIGCIYFYKALNLGEVSRIVPFVGSFVAIFILILSTLLIGERLSLQQYIAFILLVLGSLIVSYKKKEIFQRSFGLALFSALLFAIFWVITKYIFSDTTFVSGLIWVRTGVVFISLFLLLPRKNRQLIFKETAELKFKTIGFFSGGRILSIAASFFMYLAVFLGSVTLANSLQGLQYAFVLILALLLFRKIPSLREEFSKKIIAQKVIAIILIGIGLFILII
ncbi:MAG: EamA family transporter [Patescibacteria group bacterium]